MKPSDLIEINYKLKHARSKKAVIKAYPDLAGKTVKEVKGLISVNNMVLKDTNLEEQKRRRHSQKWTVIRRKYGR